MTTTPEHILKLQKDQVQNTFKVVSAFLMGAERLYALNMGFVKTNVDASQKRAQAMLTVKGTQDLASIQSEVVQPALQQAAQYSRQVFETLQQTQAELLGMFETQLDEANRALVSTLDQAAKQGPAGSDVAVNAMKQGLTAVNAAYDSLNKASKQAATLVESNIAAATDSLLKTTAAKDAAARGKSAS